MNQSPRKPLVDNSDDEDNPDTRESWMWGGKKAYIFLIDATEQMFEKDIEDKSYIEAAFEACKKVMIQDIYRQNNDLFGIVLYGTKQKGQGTQANHITTLQNLALCNADRIKELINILEDVDGFEKQHGHSKDFSLAEALWSCLKMVSNYTKKIHQKTILLMTCNDNPHSMEPKLQHDTRTRASDLNQVDMLLKILPFGVTFNPDLFFKEVVELSVGDNGDEVDPIKIRTINSVDDAVSFVEQLPTKRSSSRVFWFLGEGVKLGVAAYSCIKSTTPFPKKVMIERSKNNIVQSHKQFFNSDTGEEVAAAEISKAMVIGGQTIIYEKEEIKTAVYVSQPGLVLLGFKPTSALKLWHQIESSVFLYPEERLVKGSRTLFAALHEKCNLRQVSPICYYTSRRGGKPKLVALFPQTEKLDKDGCQLDPPGFLVRVIPYADNIRDLSAQQIECPHPEPELVELARKIIRKTKFKYNPLSIDNPKLSKHWAGIEALALGYENPEEIFDYTRPDRAVMDSRIDSLATDFMTMAFPEGFCEETLKKKSAKRAVSTKAGPSKKAKLDLENVDMIDVARQGLVEQLKNDQLKEYLTNVDVKVTRMKKAELVKAVYIHLGIDQP